MLVVTVLLGLAVWALYWWFTGPYKNQKMLEKIPGLSPILPIFGNTLHISNKSTEAFFEIVDLCNKNQHKSSLVKVFVGPTPMVFVFKAGTAEHVLKSMKNLSKSLPYHFLLPWLGTGLLTSTGQKWQTRRKLLTPTFHFKILADFLDVFNEQAEILVDVLEKKCGTGSFDVFPCITMCALDIICETAMGKTVNAQKSRGQTKYIEAIFGLSALIERRVRSPWQWNDFIYGLTERGRRYNAYLKILHEFTKSVIAERKQQILENPQDPDEHDKPSGGKRRLAFMDLLLHMAQEANFTDSDIQEETDTFMFEGHDTTAAGMTWAVQLIGRHPEVQKKLHKEMDEVFGDSDRPVTMEDLNKLKYLECVIKESLRVCPPVPTIGRTVEEDTEIEGVTIPKGASLSVLIYRVNRDPEEFPNPDKFDPERFRPENSTGRHPYTFIPFSAGPRNCIGQRFALNEEKCVLSALLRNFQIESVKKTEDITPIPELIMRPGDGVHIKLTKRKK